MTEMRDEWNPIETVPRDGTRVNLKRDDEVVCAAYWGFGDESEPHGTFCWILAPRGWRPTHWQPVAKGASASK